MKMDLIERETAIDCVKSINCKKDERYREQMSKLHTTPKADVVPRKVVVDAIDAICKLHDTLKKTDKKISQGLMMALDIINDCLRGKDGINESTGIDGDFETKPEIEHRAK